MKNLKKIINNQTGLSMIEVLMAMAMSAIISMAVMKTNENGIKGMNAVSTRISLDMWKSSVLVGKYNNPVSCMENYTNLGSGWTKASGVSGTTIYENDGATPFLSANDQIIGTSGDWQFISVRYEAFTAEPTTPNKGSCDALIRVRNNKASATAGTAVKQIRIPIVCNLDASATTLVSCSGSSDGLDSLWGLQLATSGPDAPEYVYRNGNVLIGTAGQVATAPLQVNIVDSNKWPAGATQGSVHSAVNIASSEGAIALGTAALYGKDSCLYVASDNAGEPSESNRFCMNGAYIGSNSVSGTSMFANTSTAIASTNGQMNGVNTVMIGSELTVIGGANSMALGGSNVNITGVRSIGTGEDNIIPADHGFVSGTHIYLEGLNSGAIGKQLHSTGAYSFTMGSNSANNSTHSFVGGVSNFVSHELKGRNFVFGASNVLDTSDSSYIMGYGNYLTGNNSYLFGAHATINHNNSMVLGTRNSANKIFSTKDNQFTAGFANGYRFYTDDGSTATELSREGQAVYIGQDGHVGIGKDIHHTPIGQFLDDTTRPKLYVAGKGEFHYTSKATASYKNQAAVFARNTPYTSQSTGKYQGVYASVASSAASHTGYAYAVMANAKHSVAGSGRTYGTYSIAGNGTSGWNYGAYGTLNGSNNGAGVFGTLEGAEFSLGAKYAGYFNGNMHTKGNITYTGTITDVSDKRLKENIKPLGNTLDKILSLESFKYNMKDDKNKTVEIGLMAQDVEKVFPELILEKKVEGRLDEGKFKTLSYTGLIAPIIAATKEMYAKFIGMFDKQDERISKLEKQNAQLQAQLDEQRKMILDMKKSLKRGIASEKK